jgi:hypothetical protein
VCSIEESEQALLKRHKTSTSKLEYEGSIPFIRSNVFKALSQPPVFIRTNPAVSFREMLTFWSSAWRAPGDRLLAFGHCTEKIAVLSLCDDAASRSVAGSMTHSVIFQGAISPK